MSKNTSNDSPESVLEELFAYFMVPILILGFISGIVIAWFVWLIVSLIF